MPIREKIFYSGFCIFYFGGSLRILRKNKISDEDLDKILNLNGVNELVYNKITKSLFIRYNTRLLTARRLFNCIKKIFPREPLFLKRADSRKIKESGIITPVLKKFMSKIDRRFDERLEKCKDVALIMPVGAATQPIKGYYKKILSRPWLQFIWQLIVF